MTRYTVNNRNTLLSIPWDVTVLTVAASSCNEDTITVVDLSSFKFLRSVVIGNNCFHYVQVFSIVGLNWLESVSIGYRSFDSSTLVDGSQFKIVNCPQLKSLSIGGWSFGRYNGFELSQLPQLKSVVVSHYNNGYGTYYGSFVYTRNAVFRGMNDGRDGL